MAKRFIASTIAAAAVLAAAPAGAGAALVYVKGTSTSTPQVWVARDDAAGARKIGRGSRPRSGPGSAVDRLP